MLYQGSCIPFTALLKVLKCTPKSCALALARVSEAMSFVPCVMLSAYHPRRWLMSKRFLSAKYGAGLWLHTQMLHARQGNPTKVGLAIGFRCFSKSLWWAARCTNSDESSARDGREQDWDGTVTSMYYWLCNWTSRPMTWSVIHIRGLLRIEANWMNDWTNIISLSARSIGGDRCLPIQGGERPPLQCPWGWNITWLYFYGGILVFERPISHFQPPGFPWPISDTRDPTNCRVTSFLSKSQGHLQCRGTLHLRRKDIQQGPRDCWMWREFAHTEMPKSPW